MAYIVPVFLYSDNNTCRHIDTLWLTLTHIKHCFFLKKSSFIRAFKTSQWIHVWYGFFFPLQSPILKMWPSCAPNSIRKTSFLFYKLSFIFVCLIVVVTVTLWESTNREAVNLGLFCCCDLQYIWGNNKKKTLVLCVVMNWFGCSSFFFFSGLERNRTFPKCPRPKTAMSLKSWRDSGPFFCLLEKPTGTVRKNI